MKKIIATGALFLIFFCSSVFAEEYTFFYGDNCSQCAEVEKFFEENNVLEKYDLEKNEIYNDNNNLNDLIDHLDDLGLSRENAGIPFLVVNGDTCSYKQGAKSIIGMFTDMLEGKEPSLYCTGYEDAPGLGAIPEPEEISLGKRLSFFGIMLPAALADSINPCAFAVMLLLLSSILTRTRSRKKAIWAGLLFALAVFISYLAIGLGIFTALSTATNLFVLKIIVGILGILVGLANLKDYFWYGKVFIMEIPLSWRPMMQKIIKRATSPFGAFVVGFLVSLFLLPCTSGPYITILGYLASESNNLHFRGYIYLVVYNLIFTLPMILIALFVGLGLKSAEELVTLKNKNKKIIHLIVALLMLGLGLYILTTL